ncbi:pre-rRNA-processing protein esf1 [Allomyces arbusculus]|nr:pre-rRNA-processing protein esf1 [Allomyces arbusculus]
MANPKKKLSSKRPTASSRDDVAPAVVTDSRFAAVHNDPRFKPIKKKNVKVKVDARFKDLIQNDKEFEAGPAVDKYGRRVGKSAKTDELARFYDLESSSDENEESDEEEAPKKRKGKEAPAAEKDGKKKPVAAAKRDGKKPADRRPLPPASDSSPSDDSDSDADAAGARRALLMRGEAGSDSDSDDSASDADSESDLDVEELDLSAVPDEPDEAFFDEVLDRADIPVGDATRRFAVVNMDWDHLKAHDLYKVFDSVKPQGAVVKSVTVYPSEFGKERLAAEEAQGPMIAGVAAVPVAMDAEESDEDEDEKKPALTLEEEDDTDYNAEALRRYQLERLRYYYAVVECDSVETAAAIFKQCDGAEFEATSNFFDLRYIPDDVSFDEDTPRDVATGAAVDYKPHTFETKALQHTNVKLTWDEDDPDRVQVTRKKLSYNELKAMDFKAYIASDSESDNDEDAAAKYRALLGLTGEVKGKDGKEGDESDSDVEGDMQITFTPGLSEAAAKLIKDRDERKMLENETTIERYQRKERERKQKRKDKFKNANADEEESAAGDADAAGFDDPFFAEDMDVDDAEAIDAGLPTAAETKAAKQAKKQAKKQLAKRRKQMAAEDAAELAEESGHFEVDVADARFQSVLAEPEFAIDPTNPHFKNTPGMQKMLSEKRKRAAAARDGKQAAAASGGDEGKKGKGELNLLVDAVKRKSSAALKDLSGAGIGRRKKPRNA